MDHQYSYHQPHQHLPKHRFEATPPSRDEPDMTRGSIVPLVTEMRHRPAVSVGMPGALLSPPLAPAPHEKPIIVTPPVHIANTSGHVGSSLLPPSSSGMTYPNVPQVTERRPSSAARSRRQRRRTAYDELDDSSEDEMCEPRRGGKLDPVSVPFLRIGLMYKGRKPRLAGPIRRRIRAGGNGVLSPAECAFLCLPAYKRTKYKFTEVQQMVANLGIEPPELKKPDLLDFLMDRLIEKENGDPMLTTARMLGMTAPPRGGGRKSSRRSSGSEGDEEEEEEEEDDDDEEEEDEVRGEGTEDDYRRRRQLKRSRHEPPSAAAQPEDSSAAGGSPGSEVRKKLPSSLVALNGSDGDHYAPIVLNLGTAAAAAAAAAVATTVGGGSDSTPHQWSPAAPPLTAGAGAVGSAAPSAPVTVSAPLATSTSKPGRQRSNVKARLAPLKTSIGLSVSVGAGAGAGAGVAPPAMYTDAAVGLGAGSGAVRTLPAPLHTPNTAAWTAPGGILSPGGPYTPLAGGLNRVAPSPCLSVGLLNSAGFNLTTPTAGPMPGQRFDFLTTEDSMDQQLKLFSPRDLQSGNFGFELETPRNADGAPL